MSLLIRLPTLSRSRASISRKNPLGMLLHHLRSPVLMVLITRQGQAEPPASNIRIAMPLPSAHEGFRTHPEQQYGPPSITNLEHAVSLPHMNGGQHIPTSVEGVGEVVESGQELAIPTMFDSSGVNYLVERLQFGIEIVRDADNPSQSLLSRNTCIRDDDPPLTIHPALDSSNVVNLDAPACKRLIRRAFSPQEVTSLIEAIFVSEDEAKIVRDLREDDAQTFIDVIHEVCSVLSFSRHSLLTCLLSLPSIRLWTFRISNRSFGGRASVSYVESAVAKLCFQNHSKSHFATIGPMSRYIKAGSLMCGRVNTKVATLQSRY